MRKRKFVPPRVSERPEAPFPDAETAWFWYVRCQQARMDRVEFEGSRILEVPPCDPEDIANAVSRLIRERRIRRQHVGTLNRYGVLQRPPDPRCGEENHSYLLWDEALDKLTTVLRGKEIIE